MKILYAVLNEKGELYGTMERNYLIDIGHEIYYPARGITLLVKRVLHTGFEEITLFCEEIK